jgi:CRISPR system Cascade subunit CasA
MNLLRDPWIPVRDAEGQREWIAPERLGEPGWQSFDADRPDFNGALAQFAIGLLQTTTPVADVFEWRERFRNPPDVATLRQWFAPVTAAFELDGDGPRFMQDTGLGSEGVTINGVGALLIESPGEQTLKNNADLFVKRGQVDCLCQACAATALFALQTNAPAGGAGHRTGLRGGGPLTTLVLAPEGSSLWQHLWINVRDQPGFLAQGGNAELPLDHHAFPWLGPVTQLQALRGETAMAQVHPAHHFWAMPRRIRGIFDHSPQGEAFTCSLCSRECTIVLRRYGTKNYGLNYKGEWNHPLSPYYATKEGWLPLHPQSDGLGYRHWLSWVLGVSSERRITRVAPVVVRSRENLRGQAGSSLRLWAFGFDMDNMKARCWYESTMPLYGLTECEPDAVAGIQTEVGLWLSGAELACLYLRNAVKDAWFGHEARGDFSHVDAALWSATEASFYGQLKALVESARAGTWPEPAAMREGWHRTLTDTALRLFDQDFVGTGAIERQDPRRASLAYRQLKANLRGPKMKIGLALPSAQGTYTPTRRRQPKRNGSTLKESI